MNFNYDLVFSNRFLRQFKKLTKKDVVLRRKIYAALDLLKVNPFDERLSSHKAIGKLEGELYASTATKDLHVLWDFREGDCRICLLYTSPSPRD